VGVRTQDDQTTVHAESFHLFGLTIPDDDQNMAWEKVPDGVEIRTVSSDPLDWTSVVGVITNILGFTSTQISYTK
jgi:hypothetical protein